MPRALLWESRERQGGGWLAWVRASNSAKEVPGGMIVLPERSQVGPWQKLANRWKRLRLRYARRLRPGRFDRIWAEYSDFPRCINLSLSLRCNSDCIFCPERGAQIAQKTMPMTLVLKILEEAAATDFKGRFCLSENGEMLTHPQFAHILHEVRQRFPSNGIELYSNMALMNEDQAMGVLREGVNILHFNLDGATKATYEYIKRNASYGTVRQNITRFLRLREEMKSDCRVSAIFLTARSFSENIEGRQGVFEDDSAEIIEFLKPMLREGDSISPLHIALNTYQFALDRKKTEPCDHTGDVLEHAFVAPNGQVYICCVDYRVSSDLGNLNEQTLHEIWSSDVRENALKSIYLMKYEGAFEVCRTCTPACTDFNCDLYFEAQRRIRKLFREGKIKYGDSRLV